jgi:DNA-binding response OmpR family regulator
MTSTRRPPILVVDDDEDLRVMLQVALSRDEYDVTTATSTEDALRKLSILSFEVAIIDLRLPGMDGVYLLREVQRRWPDTMTIVLTAFPTLNSAVAALRAGAHDYLTKPCPPSEIRRSVQEALSKRQGLTKRLELMRALEQQLIEGLRALREGRPAVPIEAPLSLDSFSDNGRIVRAGSFLVDRDRHEALLGEMPLDLTPTEFEILACLAERAPAVISPRELARRALNYDASELEAREIIRWHIHHLRRKLEVDPGQPQSLKNVRGIGYKLDIT